MGDLEAEQVDHSSACIDWNIRWKRESEDDVVEDWEGKASCEPGEVSSVGEEVALLVLLVNHWKERVDKWFKIIVNILIIECEMYHEADPKEGIIQHIANFAVVVGAWESALSEEEEDAEGDDHILPSEEDEEVGEAIDEPSPVMQDQSIEESELPDSHVAYHRGWVSLSAHYTDSDIRLFDHTDVVTAVSDCQHD